jgi:hypothetical protein
MEKDFLPDLPVNLSPSDLAKALRAIQVGGNVMQMPNNSALAQGRIGYEFPLDEQSQFIAGVSGQKGINNQYIPTRPTGFDVGYQDPRQSLTVGYNANPQINPNNMVIGKHGIYAKYNRNF